MIDESEIARQIPLVADSAAKRTLRCPPSTQLAAYVDARLGENPRSEVEEHLADCAFCVGQIGFLVRDSRAQAAVPLPADLVSEARERPTRRFGLVPAPALTALAATALLLVVSVLWQPNSGFGPARSYVEAPADRTVRNGAVTVAPPRILQPGEGEIVGRLPLEIRWSTSPGALQYSVQLLSLAGDLVWEGPNAGEETIVPPQVALEPGQRYYVWVEARLPSGAVSRSDAVAFRVAPD